MLCKFDIELAGGKKLELKSYSSGTLNNIATNTSFRNQLRAYLFDANSINDLEYIFNGVKVNDLNLIKGKFQELFTQNNYAIYDQIGGSQNSFLQSLQINNLTDFIDAVESLSDNLYNFVKIHQ